MKLFTAKIAMGAAVASLALGLAAPASAERGGFITIGTGGVTGVYYPSGGAICRMVNQNRKSHGLRCSVESTGGSVYNSNALASGELDIGVVQSDVGYKAWNGQEPFQGKVTKLRSLFSLHPESVTLTARKDAGINGLKDIVGKRINIGNPGSGQARTAGELLEVCGISEDKLALAGRLKASEMPDALRDNKLDAYFYVVGHPTANIKDVATSVDINIVPLTGGCVDKLVSKYPYFVKAKVPAGIYRGVDSDVPTYGVKATIVTTSDLSDKAAYEVVKGVFENLDSFKALHPAFRILEPKEMLQGLSAPIHPGAEKYYKEKGLL
ncbi:TAXI family TRAP transporter solute-binding subunit [Magnetofaba australis]|uniref:Putative TRAP transporter solute receptor n=1 Tax=Magnetofaba australis IT-1 TaxID=1434232 RepID=A0A1Y2K2B4_9PROT|nr:TAXI family TRAP transporter solute-binding subunit [Magnetofaba australis]OSM02170.1 putative TRAP transporter solute receptor [Magnetofaba australis IT-1]